MSSYLGAVWKCRYFWLSLVQMDLRARYRRSVLGLGWSLLHPIAMTVVLCTVFHKLFNQDIKTYGPWLLVGICFWNFITTVTTQGCQCLFQGEKYIRQYPAPMAIYPLRTVLGASFHFLVALLVALVMQCCFNGIGSLAGLPILIPTLVLLFILGWSLALLAGFATAYFPDSHQIAEIGLQILFYGSAIITPPAFLREKGMGWIVDYNPLAALVAMVREPILSGHLPPPATTALACLTVCVMAGAAVYTLVRLQQKIIFQL